MVLHALLVKGFIPSSGVALARGDLSIKESRVRSKGHRLEWDGHEDLSSWKHQARHAPDASAIKTMCHFPVALSCGFARCVVGAGVIARSGWSPKAL